MKNRKHLEIKDNRKWRIEKIQGKEEQDRKDRDMKDNTKRNDKRKITIKRTQK